MTAPRPAPPQRRQCLALARATPGLAEAAGAATEGGEAGAVAGGAPEATCRARVHSVEGHPRGAAELYRPGRRGEAAGVACHPEAGMRDEVREGLAARGAQA